MTLAQVKVEISLAIIPTGLGYLVVGDSTLGLVGTGTVGPDEVWSDVTAYVSSVATRRGSSRVDGPVLRYDPGTATILLDNSARRFDPTNTAGPYASGGVSQLTPRRPIRITGVWAGVTYPIFRGFVDGWQVQWGPGPAQDSVVTVTATDATKILANYNGAALGAPVGAGESSGARVNRILDAVENLRTDRQVAVGDTAVSGTTLATAAWSELLLVSDTELGELYVDAAGRIVFRNRQATISETRSTTSQLTLGDTVNDTPYEDLSILYDDTQLINQALIGRVGGTQQVANDASSQQQYLKRTQNRTDLLMTTDASAADYAAFLVYQGKDPELRFDQVTLNAMTFDPLWPQVLGRDFGDRITITRNPPGGGTITRDCFIRGVSHTMSAQDWVTTWTLQSASRYQFLTLNDPQLGVLDANALAY